MNSKEVKERCETLWVLARRITLNVVGLMTAEGRTERLGNIRKLGAEISFEAKRWQEEEIHETDVG